MLTHLLLIQKLRIDSFKLYTLLPGIKENENVISGLIPCVLQLMLKVRFNCVPYGFRILDADVVTFDGTPLGAISVSCIFVNVTFIIRSYKYVILSPRM